MRALCAVNCELKKQPNSGFGFRFILSRLHLVPRTTEARSARLLLDNQNNSGDDQRQSERRRNRNHSEESGAVHEVGFAAVAAACHARVLRRARVGGRRRGRCRNRNARRARSDEARIARACSADKENTSARCLVRAQRLVDKAHVNAVLHASTVGHVASARLTRRAELLNALAVE